MLGECIDTSDMEGHVGTAIKPLKAKMTSPPVKVFKQARLPFAKIVHQKQTTPTPAVIEKPAVKKRKLSDDSLVAKSAKLPRNVDDLASKLLKSPTCKKVGPESVIVIDDNEVSSSSEAENVIRATNVDAKVSKPKVGLIDSFVRPVSVLEKSISSTTDDSDVNEKADKKVEIIDVDDDGAETESPNTSLNESMETVDEPKSEDCPVAVLSLARCDQSLSTVKENESVPTTPSNLTESSVNHENKEGHTSAEVVSTPVKGSSQSPPEGVTPSSVDKSQKKPLSAKKIQQETERNKKREEKERLKAEKQQQREAEKAERERIKQEEKERKDKEREEAKAAKEKERKEKQDKLDQEKQEKLRIKEEERQKKEAILQQKLEEKKKKEAEKLEKEEEKRKEEEERLRKKHSQKNALLKFFNKVESTQSPPKAKENTGPFMAFEVKKDMTLAPTIRVPIPECVLLDQHLSEQNEQTLYLDELKSGKHKKRSFKKTRKSEVVKDVDVEIVEDDKDSAKKSVMKVKLLQFDKKETIRPAYYGTWRKKSKKISPRNPLKKDEDLLDYEVESDEEWEEEEPGESLSNSEGEDEDEPENTGDDEEDDGFFVPHGYLSDDEEVDNDEELSHEAKKARQIAKARDWETQMKRKCQAVKALVIGCMWLDSIDQSKTALWDKLQEYKIESLQPTPFITTFNKPKITTTSDEKDKKSVSKGAIKQPVPEEALPDLIRLVHGNPHSILKLVREFGAFWRLKTTDKLPANENGSRPDSADSSETNQNTAIDTPMDANDSMTSVDAITSTPTCAADNDQESPKDESVKKISLRQLEKKIRKIAVYEKREGLNKSHWFVNLNILEKYKLTSLPVPCEWNYIVIKPTVKKDKADKLNTSASSTPVTPKGSGRSTPSIMQFTVGISPCQVESMQEAAIKQMPLSSTPCSSRKQPNESNMKESAQPSTKTTPKHVNFKSIASFAKPVAPHVLFAENNKSPKSVVEKSTVPAKPISMDVGDDDCRIVDSSPVATVDNHVAMETGDDDCMIIGD